MITRTERLLAEFVNREAQVDYFRRMLDEAERPILVLWGNGGLGKSSLVTRLIAECKDRNVTTAQIDESGHGNYLSILRAIRDAVSTEPFARFNDLVNFFTVRNYSLTIHIDSPGPIRVAEGANISGSQVGDIAGVIVKDFNILEPRNDMDVPAEERMARLTDRFLKDLATAAGGGRRIVIFFDTAEKMPKDTREWVWSRLLAPLLERALPNVRFVFAGREKPAVERFMSFLVQESELVPLKQEHIVDYLKRRGVNEEHRDELATLLLAVSEGNPHMIALQTDRYLETKRARGA